ncbi:YhdP family protein [Gemmobacter serpentinus]|uniref:YhdP family protein n=1 Tax=Gemmobacter serpentinus TaxID=2652247 RepID=UPI001CF6E518|nr:AsmA family protein [Gemmobacter serpentinus]
MQDTERDRLMETGAAHGAPAVGHGAGSAPDEIGPPDPDLPDAPPRRRMRKRARFSLWLLASLVLIALAGGIGLLALTGKPLRLPVWVVAEAEARLNEKLPLRDASISIGAIEVMVDRDWVPRLRLEDVTLTRHNGPALLRLPEARVAFDPASLLRGALRPSSVVLSGATLRLRRDHAGRFDLDLGNGAPMRDLGGFAEMLDRLDAVFALPALAELDDVTAEALSLRLEDARAGRVWTVGDGRLVLLNQPDEVKAQLTMTLLSEGNAPAQALLSVATRKDSSGARLRATVDGVEARDIAAQAPVLGFLSALDAPISGRLITGLAPDGRVIVVEGALNLGAGALQPSPAARPIGFDSATLGLTYDPKRERVLLQSLQVESRTLRLNASGHVDAPGVSKGLPEAFLAQIALEELKVDPEGLFTEPVTFKQGALDLRLRLDPFRIDVGQFTLLEEGRQISAKGWAEVGETGWRLSSDMDLDAIRHDRMLALWPVSAVPKTRAWLVENVYEGLLQDVRVALRLEQGQEPRLSLGYDFSDGDVRFLKTLPPIRNGSGYATIEGNSYTMVLDKGQITPPKGGVIDMGGSVFSVLDILQKPAQAEIRLNTKSSLTAALSLLDEKPFNFLTKAGRSVDLGTGQARLQAVMRLPLVKKVEPKDVSFQIDGQLSEVRSDVLVPGRVLEAKALTLTATPRGMDIKGPGAMDGVPFEARYHLPFGKGATGGHVEGTVELSPRAIKAFKIGLPEGSVSGKGTGRMQIDLPKGAAPRLTLESDLKGLALRLPEIGFSKAAGTGGKLSVSATLGKPVMVDKLSLTAPGLEAAGRVVLKADGGLDRVELDRAKIASWFDGKAVLRGRGQGRSISVDATGGRLDLRNLPDLGSGGGGAGSGGDTPIKARLDRVVVTDSIALWGLNGDFATRGGFNGSFAASLNGTAPIRGTLVPARHGTAIRVTSQDAGGVLAAAGIFSKAAGGVMDLQLVPLGPKGHYAGSAHATAFRVRNAPVLAGLLSAVSVVGLLEQLSSEGLVFSEGEAQFRLTPAGVEVQRGAAVGLSMGVSMAGTYDARSKRIDMQGVISPIYMLNGIGAALTRQGEGLFGFNYRLSGASSGPDISVNPLSILTPGMFREIFRRPVPRLQE